MAYILFAIYFCGCIFFITKLPFVKNSGLLKNEIIVLFTIRILASCILGYISYEVVTNSNDYRGFNDGGINEYHNLFNDTKLFLTDIFISNYSNYGDYFGNKASYFNDLGPNIILKVLGIFNIFSRGNYYINALFFNTICFVANVALHKVFADIYADKKIKYALILGCFLLPSTLYFTSGLHKDLVIFSALSIFCYSLYFGLKKGFTSKKIVGIISTFLMMLFIRNFVAILLFPFAVGYYFTLKHNINLQKVVAFILLSALGFLLFIQIIPPQYNPLQVVVAKQQAFFALQPGKTQFVIDTLQPTVQSFLKATPSALRHSFLSPLPGEFNNIFTTALSIEILFFCSLMVLLFFSKVNVTKVNVFVFFMLFFCFCIFLFIGFITPNNGALVRYRSIYLPFFIIPILCNVNIYSKKSYNK